jgi:Exoribonuclease R
MSRRAISLSGIITILRDGRGLINHASDSVFISKYHLNGALDKDEVKYSIQSLRHVPYKRAKVLRVIKRSNNTFIGRIYNAGQDVFISLFPHQSKKVKTN